MSQGVAHAPRYLDQSVLPKQPDTSPFAATLQSAKPFFWVHCTCECSHSPDEPAPRIVRVKCSDRQDSLGLAARDGEGPAPMPPTQYLLLFHSASQESDRFDAFHVAPEKMETECEHALRPCFEIGNQGHRLCLPSRPQPDHIGSTRVEIPWEDRMVPKTTPGIPALPMGSNDQSAHTPVAVGLRLQKLRARSHAVGTSHSEPLRLGQPAGYLQVRRDEG